MIKLMFSVVSLLVVLMVLSGRRFLKSPADINMAANQVHPLSQLLHIVLSSFIILLAFSFKSGLNCSIYLNSVCVAFTIAVLILAGLYPLLKRRIWALVLSVTVSLVLLEWVTNAEESLGGVVMGGKILSINLLVVDAVWHWCDSIANGNSKPFAIGLVYYLAFFLGYLTVVGKDISQYMGEEWMLGVLLTIYLVFKGIIAKKKV